MIHELKIMTDYFEAVVSGKKTFELRKDDRNYQTDDILNLKEWNGMEYTGREIVRRVTYKLNNSDGLRFGYCILAIDSELSFLDELFLKK